MTSAYLPRRSFLQKTLALGLLATVDRVCAEDLGTFTNPVIAADWPDPAIYGESGVYYSVATGPAPFGAAQTSLTGPTPASIP